MNTYIIFIDEPSSKRKVCYSEEEAIKIFDEETKRWNKQNGYTEKSGFQTATEFLKENPDWTFDEFISSGTDCIYCIKKEGLKMGYCETINCGYWYKDEDEDFATCHYDDRHSCAPCDEEEEEE